MPLDPLFNINVSTRADRSFKTTETLVIGFFICSFDHTYGVNILYSYPPTLKSNSDELSILKTHCIWKLDRIPLRIDLKFSEFIYSAFQLHIENQENNDPETNEELPIYVVILKLWKAGKQVPGDRFFNFKTKIEKSIGSGIEFLYKKNKLTSIPAKRQEYKELLKKTTLIENKLNDLWLAFQNQLGLKEFTILEKIQPSFSPSPLSKEGGVCTQELFQKKIEMRTFIVEENPNQLLVILSNRYETLLNVHIHISKLTEFFSETHWEQYLEEWPFKEELFLEFERSNEIQKYLIKITSRNKTIIIKSIEIDPLSKKIDLINYQEDYL